MRTMNKKWITSWSTAKAKGGIHLPPLHLNNGLLYGTARTVLKAGIDGEKIRINFSNRYGTRPVTLSAVSVAHLKDEKKLLTDKPVKITFGGKESVTISKGEEVLSDEIDFETYALKKIAVNIYCKKAVFQTKGMYGSQTYLAAGNLTESETFAKPRWHLCLKTDVATFQTNPFMTRIDVLAKEDAYALVIAGDSTMFNEIPFILSERLHEKGIHNISVIQQALPGNRILDDGKGIVGNLYGENLLTRFDKDISKCCAVKKIILKEGVNDILHPRSLTTKKKAKPATAKEIISGLKEAINKAHEMGAEIYLSCSTPFKEFGKILFFIDDFKWTEETQNMADEINSWIKECNGHEGFIPVDNFLDEEKPYTMKKDITIDYIHYHRKGQELFVDNIIENLF